MDIFKRLKKLNFPIGEYVVVGSGILDALGIRKARDLDIAVSDKLLNNLLKNPLYKKEMRYNKLFLVADDVEIITQLDWEDYATKKEDAIKTAKIINGCPFLNIEETIKFKRALGREKDFKDINALENYYKNI
jgi:hypothetical protein